MYEMLDAINEVRQLALIRTNDLSEPVDIYLKIAGALESINTRASISRARFIREQLSGGSGEELFNQFREDWDIWDFPENILTVDDFKRGFLWRFRDHTTSWIANQKAKGWFLTSPEGLLVRRYEFWTCDSGQDECVEVREGSYKEILLSLLKDGDYEVLGSPAFTRNELDKFIKTYSPKNGDYTIEEIIEDYIEVNPNYEP